MKAFLSVLAALVLSSSCAFAEIAVGAEFAPIVPLHHGTGSTNSISLTFKTDKLPFVVTARSQFIDWKFSAAGANVDVWLANSVIGKSLFRSFYGVGGALVYYPRIENGKFSQSSGVFVAPRFFAGINTYLTGFSEMYLQGALEPGVVFDSDEGFILRIQMPLSIGMRFWF